MKSSATDWLLTLAIAIGVGVPLTVIALQAPVQTWGGVLGQLLLLLIVPGFLVVSITPESLVFQFGMLILLAGQVVYYFVLARLVVHLVRRKRYSKGSQGHAG
jgi:hypothetical protein